MAKCFIKQVLKMHNVLYKIAGRFSIILNDGVHVKHRILKYKEWFLENIQPGWVVVDVGCNTGMLPDLLSTKAEFVYGIEINPELIEEAKKVRYKKNIEYICADATEFDYKGCREVDCITLSNVLEHIEDRIPFLKRIISQVNWKTEQKIVLIRVPSIEREWITLYKKDMGVEWKLDKTHFTEYTIEGFCKEMDHAGLFVENLIVRFGEIYVVCKVLETEKSHEFSFEINAKV